MGIIYKMENKRPNVIFVVYGLPFPVPVHWVKKEEMRIENVVAPNERPLTMPVITRSKSSYVIKIEFPPLQAGQRGNELLGHARELFDKMRLLKEYFRKLASTLAAERYNTDQEATAGTTIVQGPPVETKPKNERLEKLHAITEEITADIRKAKQRVGQEMDAMAEVGRVLLQPASELFGSAPGLGNMLCSYFGLDVLMMGGYLEEFHTSINAETGHHVWKMVFVDQNLATARASAGATEAVAAPDNP
jgi:hypothetical protein